MIAILDCGSSKTPYIADLVDHHQDSIVIPFLDFKSENLKNCNGVIISGAPLLVTEIDMNGYLERISWIHDCNIPVLGICFGHQLIGLSFGAFANRMKEDRDWQTIEIYEDCPLFDKLPIEIQMMEDHCEAISIPPGFELVASSDTCVNEAMQHRVKPIFGIQFHPEISGLQGGIVIDNFLRLTTDVRIST